LLQVSTLNTGQLQLLYDNSSRSILADVRNGATPADAQQPIPSGQVIEVCAQFKDLTVNPAAALDVGSGLGAFVTGNVPPFSAFGNTTLSFSAGVAFTARASLKIAQGLYSLDEMRRLF